MKTVLQGTILAMLAAGLCCLTLVAQDNGMAKPDSSKMAMPPAPQPAPEMTKMIKMMAGDWTVAEKAYPSPMMPNGGTGMGTATLTPGPGNMSLMEKYHSSGIMGSDFSGFGTFWWDSKIGAYRGMWCDTMTPGGCDTSGTTKWDGDNLVGMMTGDMGGQKMVTKFVYSDWKPNSFVMTMSSGPDASSLKPMMTFTYTKSGMGGMQH